MMMIFLTIIIVVVVVVVPVFVVVVIVVVVVFVVIVVMMMMMMMMMVMMMVMMMMMMMILVIPTGCKTSEYLPFAFTISTLEQRMLVFLAFSLRHQFRSDQPIGKKKTSPSSVVSRSDVGTDTT